MVELDPITLEILTEGLISVVREMRATVFRTARSVAIYEGRDYSCALFDPQARVAAQSEDNGAHVVPMPWTVEAALADLDHDLAAGDVVMINDPYRGGTHLNDVTLIYPIFEGERLSFIAAVREHWADVGGAVPGSMSGSATEIYQEGIRIPAIKIIERGRLVKGAMSLILANMRVAQEREGDFQAGITACKTAERRVRELVDRYGVDALHACVEQNLDRSEKRMRARIAELPNGEYYYEDYLEMFIDGRFEPLRLPIRLAIEGDALTADFTGAAPQVPAPVNSTRAVTAAAVIIALKSIFDSQAPLNQGTFRPISVIAPEGTIVNVRHPAPAGSHGEIRKRVMSVMVGALAQIAPDAVAGDTHRTSFHNLIGGTDPATGDQFVHYEWACGGNGAFREHDGPSAMAGIDWGNVPTVQSTEIIESRYPILVDACGLCLNSGGDGATRGGMALVRRVRLLSGKGVYSLLSDGAVLPAFGVRGGHSGATVMTYVVRGEREQRFDTPGKVGGFALAANDVIVMRNAGGGGYGDPLDRPVANVLDDVRLGYIDGERAHDVYGVVIGDDGSADEHATAELRLALEAARPTLRAVACAEPLYVRGEASEKRICPLNPLDIDRFGLRDDAIVELVGRSAAPLRAWVVASDRVAVGTIPLDRIAGAVLQESAGDVVRIRSLRSQVPA